LYCATGHFCILAHYKCPFIIIIIIIIIIITDTHKHRYRQRYKHRTAIFQSSWNSPTFPDVYDRLVPTCTEHQTAAVQCVSASWLATTKNKSTYHITTSLQLYNACMHRGCSCTMPACILVVHYEEWVDLSHHNLTAAVQCLPVSWREVVQCVPASSLATMKNESTYHTTTSVWKMPPSWHWTDHSAEVVGSKQW